MATHQHGEYVTGERSSFEDVTLVECMHFVLLACQMELSLPIRVSAVISVPCYSETPVLIIECYY